LFWIYMEKYTKNILGIIYPRHYICSPDSYSNRAQPCAGS
jgi:hypothetical protein